MTTQQAAEARTAWDKIAAGFDEFTTPMNRRLSEDALRRAGLTKGMRFLDVAAGSGSLSIPAARIGAHVLATDISSNMIDRLNDHARAEGLSNLEGRVMDGHALELEDDTFDMAGSQFGVMLFPDLPRGMRELARVTRPGGQVLMVTFGPPAEVEFIGFFLAAMQAAVPGFAGLPTDAAAVAFQVSQPEKLRQVMTDAGLKDVHVEQVNHAVEFESGSHMWNVVTNSNPIGAGMVAGLGEERSAEVKRVLDGMLRERSSGGPATLNNTANIAIGTK